MKKILKKIVFLFGGRKIIERKYFSGGIMLMLVNYFYKIFVSGHKGDFLLHFTSRFNFSEKLIIKKGNESHSVYISLNVSNGCYYQGYNGIEIGQGTLWASGCCFVSANHSFKDLKKNEQGKPIIIGDFVWLGVNCVILPEVQLGNYCIVGAGSVVTKSYDPYSILAGVPAKPIAKRCKSCLDKIALAEEYCDNCSSQSTHINQE
jgi:acetyltransferase-like isoleucine patch superfamily enzyme